MTPPTADGLTGGMSIQARVLKDLKSFVFARRQFNKVRNSAYDLLTFEIFLQTIVKKSLGEYGEYFVYI